MQHGYACRQATTRLLSNLGDEREAVLRAARETQWEYDDEYDDSFDAMAGATADGLADVEGGFAGQKAQVPLVCAGCKQWQSWQAIAVADDGVSMALLATLVSVVAAAPDSQKALTSPDSV